MPRVVRAPRPLQLVPLAAPLRLPRARLLITPARCADSLLPLADPIDLCPACLSARHCFLVLLSRFGAGESLRREKPKANRATRCADRGAFGPRWQGSVIHAAHR